MNEASDVWNVVIQAARETPLDGGERSSLADHADRWAQVLWHLQPYQLHVPSSPHPEGLILHGDLQLPTDPIHEDVGRLCEALTELRSLLGSAHLRISDDYGLLGWTGERYDLDPDCDQAEPWQRPPSGAWVDVRLARHLAPPAAWSPGEQRIRDELEGRESTADDVIGWIFLAENWKREIGDDDEVAARLRRAEEVVEDFIDWQALLEAWGDLLPGSDAAFAALRRAEAAAESGQDRVALVRQWLAWGRHDEAREAMARAEAAATSPLFWDQLGRAWLEIFEDRASARRCGEQARELLLA
jgi:hypothetical protein